MATIVGSDTPRQSCRTRWIWECINGLKSAKSVDWFAWA